MTKALFSQYMYTYSSRNFGQEAGLIKTNLPTGTTYQAPKAQMCGNER